MTLYGYRNCVRLSVCSTKLVYCYLLVLFRQGNRYCFVKCKDNLVDTISFIPGVMF